MVAELREQVRAGGLLGGPQPLLVLISGGRDSTCLLDLAVALRGAERVRALHVNYGLRVQADAEELRCRELCGQLGVELDVVAAGEPAAGNLHAWARELRYRQARERARASGALIATGHTASDQAETVLYRLAASPGRRALLGMTAREADLVRPLLATTREQTAAYCSERGLAWCEDASNDDPRFARARVRHGLLPALRAVHPAAESNVLRTAALLRAEAELLDALVEDELAGGKAIAVERLAVLAPALARLVVVRLAERATGGYVPQAGERVAELVELGRRGGRAELHVGGRAGAVLERGTLTMVKLPPRPGADGGPAH